MRRIFVEDNWPESWKSSYKYDLEEIYGESSNRGYGYAYQTRRNETLNLLQSALPAGARVLDIAAGQGNFSLLLAEMGYVVTWNDLRAELEEYVRMKHQAGSITYAAGNAFELTFPYLFDAVLITEVIEHVAHPDEFLAKVASLVRPDGYIIMTTPNGGYFRNKLPKFSDCPDPSIFESAQFRPDDDGHIFLLHTEEIQTFSQKVGLTVDALRLFTNPLTAGHMKLGFALRILPRRFIDYFEKLTQKMPLKWTNPISVQMGVRFKNVAPRSSVAIARGSIIVPGSSSGMAKHQCSIVDFAFPSPVASWPVQPINRS